MSNSIVRGALLTSVAWTRPPESFQSSQLSTVPNASSPCAAAMCAPLTWSSNQRSLVPEKYGSTTNPVEARICSACPASRSAAHSGSVRLSCQTIARWIGSPLRRFQTNFRAIAEAQLPIEIVAVISNRPQAAGLDYARQRGIQAIALDHTQHPDREAFDELLAGEIERQDRKSTRLN